MATTNMLRIGCEIHSLQEWKKNYRNIGKVNGASDDVIEEYKEYIDLFFKRYVKKD